MIFTSLVFATLCGISNGVCDEYSIQNCTIKNGIAECKTTRIPPVIRALPSCIRRLHIIQDSNQYDDFEHSNFSQMTNLEEFVLDGVYKDGGYQYLSIPSFKGLENLIILRIRAPLLRDENWTYTMIDTFKLFTMLQILDLSHTKYLNVEHFLSLIPILRKNPIEKLLLREIQSKGNIHYSGIINMTELLCPLGQTLNHIDLSFNDIISFTMDWKQSACMSQLKYVDLRYNILAGYIFMIDGVSGNTGYLGIFLFFSTIETLLLSHQPETVTDLTTALFKEEDITNVDQLLDPMQIQLSDISHMGGEFSAVARLLRHYSSWTEYLLHTCFNLDTGITSTIGLLACIINTENNICEVLHCFPNLQESFYTLCTIVDSDKKDDFFIGLIGSMCKVENCSYGFPVPLPPKLKTFNFSFISVPRKISKKKNILNADECIFEGNNLERLDISHVNGEKDFQIFGTHYIKGLKKLKYLNWQDSLPLFNSFFLHDMPNLEEFYISQLQIDPQNDVTKELFAQNPHIKTISITNTTISSIDQDSFGHLKQLQVLDLQGTNLTADAFNVNLTESNLTQLLLQNNHLSGLSDYMRNQLNNLAPVALNLQGNPILCDCTNILFLEWATNEHSKITFTAKDTYTCQDSRTLFSSVNISNLKDKCNPTNKLITAVLSTLLSTAAFIGLVLLTYRKRWQIRHFIFRVGQKLKAHGYNEVDNYEYDAFISYSGEEPDRLWVHRILVDTLEKQYGMKIHIHLRDFEPGEYIVNNIDNAIQKSRKVIAIISTNFVRSQWCIEEMHMVHSADRNKLLLVMYQDIPVMEVEVPPLLNYLLESRTYLEWKENEEAEKLFWRKLVHALYSDRVVIG